jgi:hypothetical protein
MSTKTELIGLMNNTKWREFFSIVIKLPVYLQLQRLEDEDFHIDHEQSNWILSEIATNTFVYVNREIEYKSIYAVRICKSVIPPDSDSSVVNKAIEQAKDIGKIKSYEDQESFAIYGYKRV